MPTLEVDLPDLNRLLGERFTLSKLRKPLRNLGMELEGKTPEGKVKIEVHHNRPDLWGVEGIARALKGYLDIETGAPNYKLKEPLMNLEVDRRLKGIRPVAVMGHIKKAEFDDASLKAIMDLQEKLHNILGRNREKISIGLYDLKGVETPIHYRATRPDSGGFIPLNFDEELTPRQILEKHPKGRKFSHLIKDHDWYPLLTGSEGKVLSMPPIINSETCRLTKEAENVGVDVTGTDEKVAKQALQVIMAAAAERGFEIHAVRVIHPDRETVTPEMENMNKSFNLNKANRKLGLKLTNKQASEIMKKMRYSVLERKNDEIEVEAPFYRFDLMHEVDLYEDLAIGYGYDELEPVLPSIEITGRPHKRQEIKKTARKTLTGLGFMEVMPYLLTSPEMNFHKMNVEGEAATVENPVSKEYSILRTWLLPGLMETLKVNKSHKLPQKVFEVGDVVILDEESENGARNVIRAAAAVIGEDIDFTYARSVAEALLREFRLEWKVEPFEHPSFLDERTAKFIVEDETRGFVGEIHPDVLLNFELEHPAAAFEVDLPQ